uniref:Uncharacterized protein n=1 Tax=uncultured marine virus TaxID=186617 RepID=A0A0F7L8G3_9VIRU|nr:hypothetical protein [uncultured marine virus]
MGGVFSSPKPPAPDPSIAESQRKQEEILKKQEKRTAEKERLAGDQLMSRRRALRSGGQRMLLASNRDNAQTGVDDLKTTLG